MAVLANVRFSHKLGTPSWSKLNCPSVMAVDYVRVYQPNRPNVGRNPPDYPTAAYIAPHSGANTDPNYTLRDSERGGSGYVAPWPRNHLSPNACSSPVSTIPGSPFRRVPVVRVYHSAAIGNNQPQCSVDTWNSGQNQS